MDIALKKTIKLGFGRQSHNNSYIFSTFLLVRLESSFIQNILIACLILKIAM